MEKLQEIIQAGAIGDAFGYQVEFDNIIRIIDKYGSNGIKYKISDELPASDDTQMTLFLWEGVNEYIKDNSQYDLNSFIILAHKYFKNWYRTQTTKYNEDIKEGLLSYKSLFKRQAPGTTCMTALGNHASRSVHMKINDSKGCGNVMRVAPLILLKSHYSLTSEQLFEVAVHQAAITHGNDEGMSATGFFTLLLDDLKNKNGFDFSFKNALNITEKLKPNGFVEYIKQIYKKCNENNLFEQDELIKEIGSGWIADEAVGVALYCSIKAQKFSDCLEVSTNHSGDSDSTASMAAQLYVAHHGLNKEDILFKTDLDEIIKNLTLSTKFKNNNTFKK